MKRLSTNTKKIIAATCVTIFSLFVCISGAFAWFTSVLYHQSNVDGFNVSDPGSLDISSINLIQFVYPNGIGDKPDYLDPQDGVVEKYPYNHEEGSFGYYNDPLDLDSWVSVPKMVTFDPIEFIINPSTKLIDLNCNSIYEITIHSGKLSNSTVAITVTADLDDTVVPGVNQILLSNCANFDIYNSTDLSDTNPLFYDSVHDNYKKYYPVYNNIVKNIDSASTDTKNFHKISYLSSLVEENAHPHLYGSPKPETVTIGTKGITFDSSGYGTFYVNVNYARDQISHLSKQIYVNNILALYDFAFTISAGGEL